MKHDCIFSKCSNGLKNDGNWKTPHFYRKDRWETSTSASSVQRASQLQRSLEVQPQRSTRVQLLTAARAHLRPTPRSPHTRVWHQSANSSARRTTGSGDRTAIRPGDPLHIRPQSGRPSSSSLWRHVRAAAFSLLLRIRKGFSMGGRGGLLFIIGGGFSCETKR